MPLDPADRKALSRVLSIQPAWTDIFQTAEATHIRGKILLHSGPPFKTLPVMPISNSAGVACAFERWTQSLVKADEMLASGNVAFAAAKDFKVATPLAAVISPSMILDEMTDLRDQTHKAFAPVKVCGRAEIYVTWFGFKSENALTICSFLTRK